ncbi:copper resistance system multicopper oxidase [Pseudomonas putida]|jgi:CopA family copper-resistance protein|uniref:Copper resistance protein A n=1 Tax=Pseudomonas putida (strain ATCC 47054 / DSM 6125 / CFBP 8728 / NCIMB 11950 / KT2440) TaxID=160488 RepID=Q88C03_PSEPK|nr:MULTISPECIES: copper resistance system multicopper oxidase [Pseudomonas]AAN70945.1 copper resistance protein A [Pseudomonas putida KT2440]MBI6919276.1 copper resistance system multicopper oxidase [Pseudomonas monteilii]MCE0940167.1 copper resistance system multicopper oxidase [Pseudomonas kurunegalensis]MCE0963603.1 copper resistance system multicopper oxidase [Pseudomonas sp. NMI4491_12]MDD2074069.1 copper resistance system multicopper oxidase [Pseudomonas putida]
MQSKTTRRSFVKGLAATGLLGGLGMWRAPVWAVTSPGQPNVLTGTDFDLYIGELPVNITGTVRTAMAINGSIPGPILRWREGDTVTLRVRNRLQQDTSIHWHGIILPANMDGVPGLSFHGIAPDGMYEYKFKVQQNGTYWYHSHSGFQEQVGVYGALVIDAKEPEPFTYDRDYVVMLSDWTDEDPARVLSKLKKQSDYYNYHKRTVGDFVNDVSEMGWSAAVADRKMWAEMKMSPTDLADVSGYTYTYLMNGQAPDGNWTGVFKPGEKIRLRFINGSAMTYFDVRIPGLKMTVVAADGQHVKRVAVDEFRIAVAETYDVIVEPEDEQAYTIFAQSMDRTGYSRGTLAVREGMQAAVPAVDPRPLISMSDMGMDHGSMAGMDHGNMAGMDHSKMAGMDHGNMAGMDHSKMAGMDHGNMTGMDHSKMAGMDHGSMAGMDHSKMAEMDHGGMAGMDHSKMAGMDQGGMADMDHSKMAGMDQGGMADMDHSSMEGMGGAMQSHPASETNNPLVDMQTMSPTPKLDDPGIGLRNNGRRVLTYADLRSTFIDPDGREPGRTIELHLTGHMEKFAWSFDGVKFSDAEPLRLKYGERLRITLVNDTMMTHPIHLHGMWSDLEDEDGNFMVRKHTIDMPPGSKRSYRVTADALGRWAYHCHLLFHMEMGMFREVRVDE